jgi:hypothetical protein
MRFIVNSAIRLELLARVDGSGTGAPIFSHILLSLEPDFSGRARTYMPRKGFPIDTILNYSIINCLFSLQPMSRSRPYSQVVYKLP